MKEKIQQIKSEALDELKAMSEKEMLSDWHRDYLGRKGPLTQLMKELRELTEKERPAAGRQVNQLKAELQEACNAKPDLLKKQQLQKELG